jgi:protein-S-isoprenylcysteine O-methyltransferase Ste14
LSRSSMFLMALRHFVSALALPVTVTIVVPLWLARRNQITMEMPASLLGWGAAALGLVSLAAGLALFAASLARFAVQGKGTLAPWDPPRHLVVSGPYRYVRNPMISGVVFILIAEALVLRSIPHAWWAAIFIAINIAYISAFEEPQLEQRFGEPYRTYCRNVGRILPRRTPWQPELHNGDLQ